MRVKNYEEWYQAVNAEHRKLSEMSHYLNEKGVERMQAFGTLGNLADVCATPRSWWPGSIVKRAWINVMWPTLKVPISCQPSPPSAGLPRPERRW